MRSPEETDLDYWERRLRETLALALAHSDDVDLEKAHRELAESYRKLIGIARARAVTASEPR